MCAEWEGEGDVAYDVFAIDELHSTALGIGRIGDTAPEPCLAGTHAYVGCPDGNWSCSWGVAGDRERVWPLFDAHARLESGNNPSSKC